jgi:hypothetical protein
MKQRRLTTGLAAICLTFLSQTAFGAEPTPPPIAAIAPGDATADIAVSPQPETVSTQVVTDETLSAERGGHALTLANQSLTAISTGSVINGNYNAGGVSISDNALSNFNGIGNVLINTGAQNNLQSGMSVVINIIN